MARVDTVIFDVGNVLIRWDPRNLYRRMGYADDTVAAIFAETSLHLVNHRELDAGADFTGTIARLASRFPQHAAFIHAFDRRWPEMLGGAIDASVEVLRRLRRQAVPVHAITNFSRTKFDIARSMFPFLDEFDELVVSGDIGMVKPDPEIFELLIERRGLDPSCTVFIDDSPANIETAARLGLATVLFDEWRTDLAAELARLGLPGA